MADYRISVDTNIDTSKLDAFEKKIKSLESKSLKIKVDVDASDISKQVTNQVNKALGTSSSKKMVMKADVDFDTNSVVKKANDTFKKIRNQEARINTRIGSGEEYRANIKEIEKTIQSINKMSINPNVNTERLEEAYRYLDQLVKRKNRADANGIDIFDGIDTTAARNFAIDLEKVDHAIADIQAHGKDLGITNSLKNELAEAKNIAKQIKNLNTELYSTKSHAIGKDVGTAVFQQASKNIESLEQRIASLKNSLSNNFNSNITNQLFTDIGAQEEKLKRNLDMKISADIDSNVKQELKQIESETAKAVTNAENELKRLNNVQINFDSISTATNKAVAQIEKLGANASDNLLQIRTDLLTLQTAMKAALDAGDVSKAADIYDELSDKIKQATSAASNMQSEMNLKNINSELDRMRQKAKATIELWRKQNSAAEGMFGKDMDNYLSRLNVASTKDEIRNVSTEFGTMQKQAKIAGVAQMNMWDSIKTKAKEYASYLSVASIAYSGMSIFRDMAQNVLEVDTAMTGLYRVTDLTQAQYDQLYSNMTSSAQKYGATLTDIINATSDWTRAGFDADTSNKLAEVTTMYQHIADLDYDTASENLLTAYNGFKDSLSMQFGDDVVGAVGYVTDVLNELDNKYSVTAAGLGEALQRSASAMQLAGNTFQETAAMSTGMTEIIQDPEKSGQALKILSLRLRGMKGELQELGEEVDPTVDNISKMQGQILNLTHGKVNIFDPNGDFKSTYEIMDGIASVWKDLSSIEQADLLENIAGKNRANEIAALIEGWPQVRSAVLDANNAMGSASRENDKYMEHMQSAIDRFIAAWQALSATAIDSGFLTNLINFGTDAIQIIDDLISRFGVLQPLLMGLFGGAGILGKGIFKSSDKGMSIFGTSFSDLKDSFTTGWDSGKNKGGASAFFKGIGNSFSEFNKSLNKFDRKALDNVKSILSKGEGNFTTKELTSAFNGTSDALFDLRNKAEQGRLSLDDLGTASIKTKTSMIAAKAATLALNVGVGLLASVAIDAAIKGFTEMAFAASKASDEADNAFSDASAEATQAQESYSNLTDLISQYKSLAKQDTSDPTVRIQIADVQSQINDLIGDEASGIDLVNGNLNEQLSLLNEIQQIQAENVAKEAEDAYKAAKAAEKAAYGQESEAFGIDFFGHYDAIGFEDSELSDFLKKNYGEFVSEGMTINPLDWIEGKYGLTGLSFDSLDTAREKANQIKEIMDSIENEYDDFASMDMYKELSDAYDYYSKYADQSAQAARTMLQNLTESKAISSDFANILDANAQQFDAARTSLINSLMKNTDIKSAINSGDLNLNDITSYVNTYLGTLENFSSGYNEWANDIKSFQDLVAVNGIGTLEGTGINAAEIETLDEYIGKMSELKEAYADFQTGELDTSEIEKLKSEFPELKQIMDDAGLGAEDFDIAIMTLLDNMNSDAVSAFNDSIGDVSSMSDEATASVTILSNAMQNFGAIGEAMSFNIDIEGATDTFSKLNEAMAASKTATGLTTEQIENINAAFGSLDGYNAAAMFEETANGIRLNTQEYNKFSKALADGKLKEADEALETLSNQYNILTSQINAAREAGDIDLATELMSDRDDIVAQTNAIAEQAAQYEGLTSAYKQWQDAQSAGNDRDMYESIGSAFEEVQDEINRGWWDDSTREYLELMTGRDLSTANINQMKDAYAQLDKQIGDTGYTIKSFFTQTEDGTFDTNGIYNFLEAAESFEDQLGKDFVKRNEDGNIIGFEIDVEGRKALAEAMGISEELIDIIIRASEDAGFVVNMDGTYTQLADMKAAAEQAATSLKEIGKTQMDFTFDTSDTEQFTAELEEAKKLWESYLNEDGSINFEAEGAQEAVELYSTLVAMADQLSEPTYMQLDASQVDAELQAPLLKMQEYERLLEKKHQIEIGGGDLTEVNAELEDTIDFLDNLPEDVKVKLGIDGMSKEEIQAGLESGTIEIPATVDLQVEMSENIEDIRMALLKLTGAITDEEYDAYIKMRLEPEVDEGDTQQKVQDSLSSALGGTYSHNVGVDVSVNPTPTQSLQQALGAETGTSIEVPFTPRPTASLQESVDNDTINATANVTPTLTQTTISEPLSAKANVEPVVSEAKDLGTIYTGTAKVDPMPSTTDLGDGFTGTGKTDMTPETLYMGGDFNGDGVIDVAPNTYNLGSSFYGTGTITITKNYVDGSSSSKSSKKSGKSPVNGTAHVNGTAFADGSGKAFKQGDWRIKGSGTALVGELGQEILVRDGRYYTVGDNGAEFIQYQPNDIIFNHKQTEELLKNGYVTSNGGRGRAFVEGTAFSTGSGGAGRPGSGGKPIGGGTTTVVNNTTNNYNYGSSTKSSSSSKSSGSSSASAKKEADEFKESLDLIEIMIDRIERAIDSLDRTASSSFRSFSDRNNALTQQMQKVREEMSLQQQAYERYLQQAYNSGLSNDWANRIINGEINVELITDENLKDQIDDFQEWYIKCHTA